jgi:ubiquitin carboxyl-terminal hydrolase 9/24
MSIDCQIRGKTDIHEALATMCEVEYMEGNNKVFCDRCKENTDTVLKTAISALPDILILSLKRFDLDYNTFETVKLNSRLAFGQTLNMKRYTLEGIEAVEKAYIGKDPGGGPSPMDTSEDGANTVDLDPLSTLSDEDYEYKLAGVLVHAGVAQGGHYYSFIKDRASKFDADHKWYRFDDEDVTPWDPASLEVECFGGKVKKETKWPNGQVHTVESEQFANALMVFYEKVKPAEHKHSDKSKKEDDQDEPMKVEELDVSKMTGFEAFEPDVLRSNATHRWQTFLFDSEFQAFLKGLLGLCRNPRNQEDRMDTSTSPVSNGSPKMAWKVVIIDMLVTFFLDVFLYSSDRTWLQHWVRTLSEIFLSNRDSAQMFVRKLAAKTATVSANWLRTYLSDCPESDARLAAVQVMGSAIQSCVSLDMEQSALQRWSKAYVEQLVGIEKFGTGPLPTRLRGKWKSCENSNLFSKGEASSIGVVISFLTVLIEAAPRTWKHNADMCAFIRDISNAKPDSGGRVLVEALQQAQIPARMTCLVTRDKAPILLRVAFPGASVPLDVVETQLRQETNPNAHLLPLGGNQMMTSTDKMPMPSDYISLFEALGVLAGMKGLVLAPLVVETDVQRSRPSIVLSDAATIALTQIYRESCTAGMPGMGQREIDNYLQRCSVDSASMPTQKIVDIMAKYPCTDNTGKGTSCLSLEGFLAYYRENAQTQEARVRVDLHTFGFRPDLTRRSHDTRSVSAANGREQPRHTTESVCIDVASLLGTQGGAEKLGTVAELGLSVFELYSTAYAACEPLAEYLLATAAFERDSSALIKNTLACLRFAPTGWAGSEVYHAALMVLKVLSSIPDRFQQDRIKEIMQCPEGSGLQDDQGVGLLRAAKSVAGLRSTQNYPNELQYVYERYVEVFKELLKLRSVFLWMDDNRELWSWMERDVLRTEESSSQRQSRGDYSVRRDGDARTASLLDPPRSDSDMHGVNDSEDDEDESVYDESKYRPERVIVQGAGLDVINGIYYREGLFENAGKYTKEGNWKGVDDIFSLFRCNVSNNTKHWYISIVPPGVQPGTNTDIDFYSAPMNEQNPDVPPARGWTKANEGQGQPPTVSVPRDERPDIEVEPRGRPKDQDRGPRTFI